MDAEERALLAAIIAHPDEDTPRLVYADWLQEHDRPERAEYIRLSIRLANLRYGDPNFDIRYWQLRKERDPLVSRFHKQWHEEFAARFPPRRDVWFGFDRGFVEIVRCSVKYFLDNAQGLFREAPIRCLWPKSLTAQTTRRLATSPWFGRLDRIGIHERDHALVLLDNSAPAIRWLDFSPSSYFMIRPVTNGASQWEPVAIRLGAHTGLGAVKRVDLECRGIGDGGGRALAESPHLNPDVLNLLGNALSDTVRQALRARYGPRVWLDPVDWHAFPRG